MIVVTGWLSRYECLNERLTELEFGPFEGDQLFFVNKPEVEQELIRRHGVAMSDLYGINTMFMGFVDERSLLGSVLTATSPLWNELHDRLDAAATDRTIHDDIVPGEVETATREVVEGLGIPGEILYGNAIAPREDGLVVGVDFGHAEDAAAYAIATAADPDAVTYAEDGDGVWYATGLNWNYNFPTWFDRELAERAVRECEGVYGDIDRVTRDLAGRRVNPVLSMIIPSGIPTAYRGTFRDHFNALMDVGFDEIESMRIAAITCPRDSEILFRFDSFEHLAVIYNPEASDEDIMSAILSVNAIPPSTAIEEELRDQTPPGCFVTAGGFKVYDDLMGKYERMDVLADAMKKNLCLYDIREGSVNLAGGLIDLPSLPGDVIIHAELSDNANPDGSDETFRDIVTGIPFAIRKGNYLYWSRTQNAVDSMILRFQGKFEEVVEFERGLYGEIVNKTKEEFFRLTTTGIVDMKTELQRDYERAKAEADAASKAAVVAANKMRMCKMKLDSFKPDESLSNHQKMVDMWFDSVKNDARVLFAGYLNNEVHVYTRTMFVENKGDHHEIGRFRITINVNNGSVNFRNLTRRVNGYNNAMHAPHIFADGHACLGNAAKALESAAAQGNIGQLINIALAFIESVNTADPAGAKIGNWPRVTKQKVEETRELELRMEYTNNVFLTKSTEVFNAIGLFLRRN